MAKTSKSPLSPSLDGHEPDADGISQYHVEDAARDLMKAEQHKQNPKLMKKVHAHLANQKKAITSIQDIKNARDQMATDPDAQEEAAEQATPASRKAKAGM